MAAIWSYEDPAPAPVVGNLPTPVEARQRAGLSRKTAAKKLRISEAYLQQRERPGSTWSFVLAERAALVYGCNVATFRTGRNLDPETCRRPRR